MKKSTSKKASEKKTENLIDELVRKDVLRVKTTLKAGEMECMRKRGSGGVIWGQG